MPPVMDWFGRPNPYIGITVAFIDIYLLHFILQ